MGTNGLPRSATSITLGMESGLNVNTLHSLLPVQKQRVASAREMIDTHVDSGVGGYVSWSGGKDSTALVHMIHLLHPELPVCWFHSGLEYPETEEYVQHLAEQWELNLHIIHAKIDALTLLRETQAWRHSTHANESETRQEGGAELTESPEELLGSFPDKGIPAKRFHDNLIVEPSAQAHSMFGAGELCGLRGEESTPRRRLLYPKGGKYVRASDGARVCAPLWNWSFQQVGAYYEENRIPLNPVYARLAELGVPERDRRAGLMFDAGGLYMGRATWLRLGWPEVWSTIRTALPRANEWR